MRNPEERGWVSPFPGFGFVRRSKKVASALGEPAWKARRRLVCFPLDFPREGDEDEFLSETQSPTASVTVGGCVGGDLQM